jgi:virginiamycin B lyase
MRPQVTELTIKSTESRPRGIALGPDQRIWFVENRANKIGVVTPPANPVDYTVPTVDAFVDNIAAGPDEAMWFTEGNADKIGRIEATGSPRTPVEYSDGISPGSDPAGIVLGPDGNLWFTEYKGDKVAEITPSGVITPVHQLQLPAKSMPDGISGLFEFLRPVKLPPPIR